MTVKCDSEVLPGELHSIKDDTYHVRPGVTVVYIASGVLMCIAAGFATALQVADFGKAYINLCFYLAAIVIAALSLTRFKTCRLTLSEKELYFYNGIIDVKRIPIKDIARIEFNPKIRIRVYMNDRGKRSVLYRIPNVFSKQDIQHIFERLETSYGIEIQHIERTS